MGRSPPPTWTPGLVQWLLIHSALPQVAPLKSVEFSATQLPALFPAPSVMPYCPALPMPPLPFAQEAYSLWSLGLRTPALAQLSQVLARPQNSQKGVRQEP